MELTRQDRTGLLSEIVCPDFEMLVEGTICDVLLPRLSQLVNDAFKRLYT
jgi:hypothetical protein